MTNVNINATSRRTLMAGSAWAVPAIVVASAAPAMAASTCVSGPVTTDWKSSNYVWTDQYKATYTVPASGTSSGSTITLTTEKFGDALPGDPTLSTPLQTNLTVPTGTSSGMAGAVFIEFTEVNADGSANLYNRAGSFNNRIEVTVTFSTPVTGLSFSLGDIDESLDFTDAVTLAVSGGGTLSGTKVDPTFLSGSGTPGDPWKPPVVNATTTAYAIDNSTGTRGNVNVTSTGTISSFTIKYWNLHTADSVTLNSTRQRIYLSNLTYDGVCASPTQ